MAMDVFSQLMEQVASLHLYTPLYASSVYVSHLLFADDVLVLRKFDLKSLQTLKGVLETISSYIGVVLKL